MAIKTPAIPSVPASDPATYQFNAALKEQVELLSGTRSSTTAPAVNLTPAQIAAVAASVAANPTYSISLSNVAATVASDASGVVASFATANGTLHVYASGVDITAQCHLSLVSQTNCTGQINTADSTPIAAQPIGYYQVSAMSANIGQMLMQAVYGAIVLQATFNISKALAGAVGAAGAGTGALSLQLSNVAMVLPAFANESVQSFGTATGVAKMFNGATDVTASSTFTCTPANCTGTINTAANTPIVSQPIGYYQITAMAANATTATFLVSGTYSGTTISQMVNVVLAVGGYQILSTLPNTNLFQGRIVFYTVDNKLYRYSGSAWITWVQASDVTGQITAAQIQDGVITTAKLLPGLSPVILMTALPAPGIAGRIVYLTADSKLYRDTGTVWTTQVATGDLAGQIPASQLVANSITAGQIQAGAITTNAMLANSITGDRISAGTLDASKIAALSITAAQIAANAINTLQLYAGAVTADKIQGGSITAAQIKSTTITALQMALGTLTSAQILAGSIVASSLQANTITANQIATGTITGASGVIGDLSVNTLQLAGNAVTVPASRVLTAEYIPPWLVTLFANVNAPYTAIPTANLCSPGLITDGTIPFLITALFVGNAGFGVGQRVVRSMAPIPQGSNVAALAGSPLLMPSSVTVPTTATYSALKGVALAGFKTYTADQTQLWIDVPPAGTAYYAVAQTGFSAPGCAITILGCKR